MDYNKIFAIRNSYRIKLLKLCPELNNRCGIYIWCRKNENGNTDRYVGQTIGVFVERQISHLTATGKLSHFDKSLKAHKLYSEDNPNGWNIEKLIQCDKNDLDKLEQYYINCYKPSHNITGGGQINKATDINKRDNKKCLSYRNGVARGQNQSLDTIRIYFDKYLDYIIKGKPTKIKERKFEEFKKLLEGNNESRETNDTKPED